jgi:hypothetical protein
MEDKMAMLDWNDYRNQILASVGEIAKLSPDTVKAYATLGGAGAKTGHLVCLALSAAIGAARSSSKYSWIG